MGATAPPTGANAANEVSSPTQRPGWAVCVVCYITFSEIAQHELWTELWSLLYAIYTVPTHTVL